MIGIGCDHGGLNLKEALKADLLAKGLEVKDFGTHTKDSCDYPDVAEIVAKAVKSGECQRAILVCGTGIGMSMCANKINGVRAACCSDWFSAKMTRLHNNANILCLGERVVGAGLAIEMADVFLATGYEGGRHAIRLEKMAELEKKAEEDV